MRKDEYRGREMKEEWQVGAGRVWSEGGSECWREGRRREVGRG